MINYIKGIPPILQKRGISIQNKLEQVDILIKKLNASFAINVLFSLCALIILYGISMVYSFGIECDFAKIVNSIAFFCCILSISWVLNAVYYLTIDLFNTGKSLSVSEMI